MRFDLIGEIGLKGFTEPIELFNALPAARVGLTSYGPLLAIAAVAMPTFASFQRVISLRRTNR